MAQCGYIREELRECLQQSPCLAKHGLTFHECLKRINDKEEPSNDFIPVRCFLLREALFSCRRGMVCVAARCVREIAR